MKNLVATETVKNAQMDLLIELDRICRKHEIPYFLVYGTLLGAIRHDGFIPWDDDIDVGMLHEDYDRFFEACRQELDAEYVLHDWHADPNSPHPYGKLKIRNTHYPEAFSVHSAMDDGVFIDIFPYDNAPEGGLARRIQEAQIFVLRKILLVRCDFELSGGSKAKAFVYGLLKLLSRIRSVEGWKRSFKKVQHRYNGKPSAWAVSLCGAYRYPKEVKPRAMLEKLTEHTFEGRLFYVPEDYDGYLRGCYGDYMVLPPEDQRVGIHGVQHVDLGDYKIRFSGARGDAK